MKRYILNSAVITGPGSYRYRLVSREEAKAWILAENPQSTIGYSATAEALSALVGMPMPVNRIQIRMEPGDQALVFRLTCRLDDPNLKGTHSSEFVLKNCEFGILCCLKEEEKK